MIQAANLLEKNELFPALQIKLEFIFLKEEQSEGLNVDNSQWGKMIENWGESVYNGVSVFRN